MSALNVSALVRNLAGFGAAWELWDWVRGAEVGTPTPRGGFNLAACLVPLAAPRDGERAALVFNVGPFVEFVWAQAEGEAAPRWPSRYTVLSAREQAPELEAATIGGKGGPIGEQAAAEPLNYARPELGAREWAEANALSVKLTNGKSMADIRGALARLLCENMALTLEVNAYREVHGLEPLAVHKTGGR